MAAAEALYPAWSFGDRLRKARTVVEMNQEDFAEAIGVKDGSLAAWETDRARPRDIVGIAKSVESVTRIPASWLLGIEAPPPHPPKAPRAPLGSKKRARTGNRLPWHESNVQPSGYRRACLPRHPVLAMAA